MTTFTVYEYQPIYCGITDAVIGQSCAATGHVYRSERLAAKVAARLEREHYEELGEGRFRARVTGDPYPRLEPAGWMRESSDELPF